MNVRFARLAAVMAAVCTATACSLTSYTPIPSLTPITPRSSHSTTTTTTTTTSHNIYGSCPVGQIDDGNGCADCPQLKPCFNSPAEMHSMAEHIFPTIEQYSKDELDGKVPEARWFIIATGQSMMTPCIPLDSSSGPVFCDRDDTIYMGEDGMWGMYNINDRGDAINVVVMSHEWGHHVQMHMGLMQLQQSHESMVKQEKQADCISGAAAKYMHEKGYFSDDDLAGILDFIPNIPPDPYGTHGTDEERLQSFETGYENGLSSCNAIGIGAVTSG